MPLILFGWAALAVSVLVPLLVSLSSWLQMRDMRCTTKFEYTFAPLLVTCGERSAGTQVLGWILWALTIGSLLTAGALAIAALVETQTRVRRRFAIFESWVLTIGAATVLLLTSGILAADQERLGGTNAWIIYASGGSTLLLILISIVHPIIWLAVKQNSGVER
ncbi:hypothetical protein [Microbacterium sp. LWH11-1.2]|uniref:hypothetical protein n=1 Tax=Microbacterium sp. LWH11-1.2 TaxID=3135258 RepID=UPI0031397B11